jgi:hypothetical protein
MWHGVVLPDLQFSEYFEDHNHVHNVDENDVLDAVIGRRIIISGPYRRHGKIRRRILGKTDSDYLTIICEPAKEFWWVISAFPSGENDVRRARAASVGDEQP